MKSSRIVSNLFPLARSLTTYRLPRAMFVLLLLIAPVVDTPQTVRAAESTRDVRTSTPSPDPMPAPELQRIVGTWIAYTQCGIDARRKKAQELLLTVRQDGAAQSAVMAEIHGMDVTAGILLSVTFDRERNEYQFTFASWLSRRGRGIPFGLTLAFLDDRDLLHGEITGRTECGALVAGRVPSETAPPNPQGLLYKVAINRVLEPLTEEECAGYARWLASGERIQAGSGIYNSAVTDGSAMRRVLGHDLDDWTDEDARKITVIHRAARKKLQASNDPAHVALAGNREIWAIPPPLRYAPSRYANQWCKTLVAVYQPLMADIRKAWHAVEAGLISVSEPVAAAKPDETGLAGEWRGYYHCEGGNEVFMRLVFSPAGETHDVRFEFGPSLKSHHPTGAMAMAATFDAASRRIKVTPQDGTRQPGARAPVVGFEGRLVGDDKIEGRVLGGPQCSEFSITKREPAQGTVNPEGLLFHFLSRNMITATVEDCREYAEWLAEGEELNLGGHYLFSGLRNPEAMRAVLGKDLRQWGEDDWTKMLLLSRHCKAVLEAEAASNREISDLLARIAGKELGWAPNPLDIPRGGSAGARWLRIEQLIMVNARQRELAARKLSEVKNLPPVIDSLEALDALHAQTAKRGEGPFYYLAEEERKDFLASLSTARVDLAVATARAMATGWSDLPESYAGLEQMEAGYREQRRELEKRNASQGVRTLEAAFRRESDRRAIALWPDVLQRTRAELTKLAKANLSRFRELSDEEARQSYLAEFHSPQAEDRYYETYRSMRKLYRETVERMVKRSKADLFAWIEALPPSEGAGEVLDEFSEEVFAVAPIPERHPKLRQAAASKKKSYNPEGYRRPDIVMSLRRGQWNEVGLVGFEDLAYLTTSLRLLKDACPEVVPEGPGPLMSLAMSLAQSSLERIMRGEVKSRREAERFMFFFLNNIANQPGVRIDHFGNIVGATTYEQHMAAQEFIMTSADAQADMQTLLRSGCGAEGAGGYVEGLVTFAGSSLRRESPAVPDFWQFLASR